MGGLETRCLRTWDQSTEAHSPWFESFPSREITEHSPSSDEEEGASPANKKRSPKFKPKHQFRRCINICVSHYCLHNHSALDVLTFVLWSLDPQILIPLCWPTMSRWSFHRTLLKKDTNGIWLTDITSSEGHFFYIWFTRCKVGDRARKRHPWVGEFWSADFGALHPDEREDTPKESCDHSADCECSAGVKVRCEDRQVQLKECL